MKKLVFGLVLVAVVITVAIAWTIYNKPHREITDETAIAIDAQRLYDSFQDNESNANLAYLNKVLEVTGRVSESSSNALEQKVLILETADPLFGVNCTMAENQGPAGVGDSVIVIGICTGYLSDVIMIQCQLKNKTKK